MKAVNEALRKPQAGEKRVIGQIQKIECKGKIIIYSVKSGSETFTLSSKDFENLSLVAFLSDAENTQVSCGAKLAEFNSVLTYKVQTDTKSTNRGELVAIDFVPNSFRFIDLSLPPKENPVALENDANNEPENKPQDTETRRREAMLRGIKSAMRQLQGGEKRELGFIEKVECNNKGIVFNFRTATQTMKLSSANPQTIQMRAFTPDAATIQFGCDLKQVDIPVVFTYKENTARKDASGELISMEFMPKSFILEK